MLVAMKLSARAQFKAKLFVLKFVINVHLVLPNVLVIPFYLREIYFRESRSPVSSANFRDESTTGKGLKYEKRNQFLTNTKFTPSANEKNLSTLRINPLLNPEFSEQFGILHLPLIPNIHPLLLTSKFDGFVPFLKDVSGNISPVGCAFPMGFEFN